MSGTYLDEIIEESHDGLVFYKKRATEFVIDDIDPFLGSVEQSHLDDLGYYEYIDFIKYPIEVDTLDLTWMMENDVFIFNKIVKFKEIKKIRVNINNLGYSRIDDFDNELSGLKLEVVNGNQGTLINNIKAFKYFIGKYRCIFSEGVEIKGFPVWIKYILNNIIAGYDLEDKEDIIKLTKKQS